MGKSQKNKYILLLSSILKYRKYFVTVFVTCLISVILVSCFLILMETSKANATKNAHETYGKYHITVSGVSDQIIRNIENAEFVKDFLIINEKADSYNGYNFRIVYAPKKYVEFTNAKLIQGTFPSSENEILTEKWFLFQMGIDESKMVGSRIVLPDFKENSMKNKEYVVTGIISENSVFESKGRKNNPLIVFPYEKLELGCTILLQIKDEVGYKGYLNKIVQTYNLNDNNYTENRNLITALGMGDVGKDIKLAEKTIFIILALIIFLASAVTIYNSINILLNKCIEAIGVFKALGVAAIDINLSILLSVAVVMILGNLVGLGAGILISKGLISFIFQTFASANQVERLVIPGWNLIFIICLFITMGLFAILPLLYRLTTTTPANALKGIKTGVFSKNKIKNRSNRLFPEGTKIFRLRLAFNNIGFNRNRQIMTIMSLSVSVFLLVTVVYFIKTNQASFGKYTGMDYRVEFIDKELLSEVEQLEQQKTFDALMKLSKDYFVYPCFERVSKIKINKDLISKPHKEFLSQNSDDRLRLEDRIKTTIDIPIIILGFTNEQMKDLLKNEGMIQYPLLGENEAIMIDNTLSPHGLKGFPVNINKGDDIDVSIDQFNNKSTELKTIDAKFKIKHISNSLNINPINTNAICIIISQDMFKKYYAVDLPETVYVKLLSKSEAACTNLSNLITGTNVLTLYNQAEEEVDLKRSSYMNSFIFILIFFITIVVTAINTATTVFMRIQLREKEYAMLRAIGLLPSSLKVIIAYEMMILVSMGLLFGYIFSIIATKIMHSHFKRMIGNYMYQIPFEILLPISGFIIIVLAVTCIPLFKRINNIQIIRILNSI